MTNYFLDHSNKSGDFADTWDWTNASTGVVAHNLAGNANSLGLVAGDKVKAANGLEWYQIASITDANHIVLSVAFKEASLTANTTSYADVSVNDGSTAAKAFVHGRQITGSGAAGMHIYVRRGLQYGFWADMLLMSGNGTYASPCYLTADDGTYWAGEGGLADPIFYGFNKTTNYGTLQGKYWIVTHIQFDHFAHTSYGVSAVSAHMSIFQNCLFSYCTMFYIYSTLNLLWINCTLDHPTWGGIYQESSCTSLHLVGCSFTNMGSYYCIYHVGGGQLLVEETNFSTFNVLTAGYYVNTVAYSHIVFRACTLDMTKINYVFTADWELNEFHNPIFIFIDCNDVKDGMAACYQNGLTYKMTSGWIHGADSSIKAIPNSTCGTSPPRFIIYDTWIYNAGEEKTYTVYVLADGTWTVLPTSSQLALEASYFNAAGNSKRTTTTSTESLGAEETWTPLTVTIHPASAGMVHLYVFLHKYQANKEIWVDPLIVVS